MTGVWKHLESFRQIFPIKPASMLAKLLQSCLTLCNPMDCTLPGSSVHGILQARILEWGLPFPSPGNLPNTGIEPVFLDSPALAGSFFSTIKPVQFSRSVVSNSATPWTAACQASLSITKFMSIESVMPSNHLILCHPLLLPPSIFPRIRVLFQ